MKRKRKSVAIASIFLLLLLLFLFLGNSFSGDSTKARSNGDEAAKYKPSLLSRILSNDIVFYGRVLDLEGNPVPHAKITYASLSAANYDSVWTGGGPPDKVMHADENGYFEIHEVGGSLYVRCTHPDYYGNSNPQEGSQRKFGYGFQVGENPARDSQSPAIFRLRKKGVREPLYYSCSKTIGKGQGWIRVPAEGLAIDLASGKAKITDRSIYISHKIREHKKNDQNFAWEYTLYIPGGGLISKKSKGAFDFIAPSEGYEEKVKIGYAQNEDNWRPRKTSYYFVKFPNGLYGIFEIAASSSGSINFQALVNPNPASRNLEYEYEQQLNKNQGGYGYWFSL